MKHSAKKQRKDARKKHDLENHPNAFARARKKVHDAPHQVAESTKEHIKDQVIRSKEAVTQFEEDLHKTTPKGKLSKANRVIAVLIVLSLLVCVAQIVLQLIASWGHLVSIFTGTFSAHGVVAIVYAALALLNFIGLIVLIVLDCKTRIFEARMVCRVLIVLLLLGLLTSLMLNGVVWLEAAYIFQFICIISYQLYNDPNLNRDPAFKNPFTGFKKARQEVYNHTYTSKGYIPLNFYNLFWVFMTASFLGLCVEMVFCLLVNHVWDSRVGVLWGPFSPIYGFGAVLMTVFLNRFWYRNILLIFVVSGIIGAAFEFFVSWYMQTAFGVIAWDYSGTFLNIDGRTDFAHACAWGLLGIIWIRLLLPGLMCIVDLIPLKWRATLTVLCFVFMVVNGIMTLMAVDCWSQREAGLPIKTPEQVWFNEHYDDKFMEVHFATMDMTKDRALDAQTSSLF